MVDQQVLSKIIKEAMKSGRYSMGIKEVLSEMKGSKLVVCTNSIPKGLGEELRREASKNSVAVVDISKNSMELGRMVGRPFRVSAISFRTVGDADLKQLV